MNPNPCQTCGACCASFRVSFYWSEGSADGGSVPVALTEALPPHRLCMNGTNAKAPRCIALRGAVGEKVSCGIYAQRSSTCREFRADGAADSACTRARAKHGLAPLAGLLPGLLADPPPAI
jgi:Fe-S-cluster containining protein